MPHNNFVFRHDIIHQNASSSGSDTQIDKSKDMKQMIKSPEKASGNDKVLTATHLKSELEKKCQVIASNCVKEKLCEQQEHPLDTKSFYPDYSHHVPVSEMFKKTRTAKKGRVKETFPQKLFELLDKSDATGYSHIISWLPHGHAFKIHDERMFERLSKDYFDSTYESFKRQLYMYGFERAGKQFTDAGVYYHEQFIRGQQQMCNNITKRNKVAFAFAVPRPNIDKVSTALKNLN